MNSTSSWQAERLPYNLLRTKQHGNFDPSANCDCRAGASPALSSDRQAERLPYKSFRTHPGIELVCLLEMFLSQLGHTEILKPARERPMVEWIVGSELIGLVFVNAGFLEFA